MLLDLINSTMQRFIDKNLQLYSRLRRVVKSLIFFYYLQSIFSQNRKEQNKNICRLSLFVLIFCLSNISYAAKYQFFLGLGQSFGTSKLTTDATNQMTKNTGTVNEKGGYFYTNTQHGSYEGSVKNITSAYTGVEVTFDKYGIFTARGYITASYSNNVNFGNLDKNSIRDGNLEKCRPDSNPGLPSDSNPNGIGRECWRDEFSTSGEQNSVTFNPNPGFSDTIAKNAFMLTYGIGADIGVNLPVSFFIKNYMHYKIVTLRIGAYGGIGYEFITYSLGKFDNRSYNNTTSGATTYDPSNPGTPTNAAPAVLNTQDSLYIAGAGMFARVGGSIYITNHLRLDIGVKIPITFAGVPNARSQKWYLQESIYGTQNTFTQQMLKQNLTTQVDMQWHCNVNVLF